MNKRLSRVMWDVIKAPRVVRQGQVTDQPEHEIWVRSTDGVGELADQIFGHLNSRLFVDVACMGANPTNIGVKAIAALRKDFQFRTGNQNVDLVCQPFFSSFVDEDGEEKTRVVLRVTLQAPDE